MKTTPILYLILTFTSHHVLHAQIQFDELKARFEEKHAELESPLAALADNYRKQLDSCAAKVREKGDLQTVIKVQEEISGFQDANFSLGEVYADIPELGEIRSIYHRHYWEIRDSFRDPEIALFKTYATRLAELQGTLTREGRTGDAIEAGTEIDRARSAAARLEALKRWKGRGAFEKTVLWEFRDRYDLVESGSVSMEQVGAIHKIASDARDGSRMETKRAFRPPLRIIARAGTDSTNVRFYYAAGPFVIFNWEVRPDELRIHDPVSGSSPMAYKGKGEIEVGTLHDLEMRVTNNRVSVYVNGALRGSRQGDFSTANGPVGIGPAFGSVVSLEAMAVFAED